MAEEMMSGGSESVSTSAPSETSSPRGVEHSNAPEMHVPPKGSLKSDIKEARSPGKNEKSSLPLKDSNTPEKTFREKKVKSIEDIRSASERGIGETSEDLSEEDKKYSPNYKFKVNHEEREFDDFIKSSIKDQDAEKKLRDIYEKAYGLDEIKPKYEERTKKLQQLEPQFNHIVSRLQDVSQKVKSGNLDSLVEEFGVSEEALFKYVASKIREKELPPEQQEQLRRSRELERVTAEKTDEIKNYQQAVYQQSVEMRGIQLDIALNKPTIGTYIDAFDSRQGDGAFRREVIKHAKLHYSETGVDLLPEQAIQQVLKFYGPFLEKSEADTSQEVPTRRVVQAETKPTLPNVRASSTAPVKKKITSMKDLILARNNAVSG